MALRTSGRLRVITRTAARSSTSTLGAALPSPPLTGPRTRRDVARSPRRAPRGCRRSRTARRPRAPPPAGARPRSSRARPTPAAWSRRARAAAGRPGRQRARRPRPPARRPGRRGRRSRARAPPRRERRIGEQDVERPAQAHDARERHRRAGVGGHPHAHGAGEEPGALARDDQVGRAHEAEAGAAGGEAVHLGDDRAFSWISAAVATAARRSPRAGSPEGSPPSTGRS